MPHPGRVAQQMPVLPASMPCVPQMAPPLRQPCPAGLAMPYQQAVQLPKKPAGRGVAADTPTNKTTPVGDIPDRGRPSTRGWGGGGRSISHPRGVLGKTSAQPPCQEGDLPSELTPSVPPPPAPQRTQPRWGGRPRSALCDPAWLAQTFIAVDGGRTWSISSGSTTDTVLTPLQSRNGRRSRSGSLTTSSSIRWKLWPLRKPGRWTLWPTSRASSIRPQTCTWMAS